MSHNFDLTPRMAPFFDPHMMVPILNFLSENKVLVPEGVDPIYDENGLLQNGLPLYEDKVLTKEKIKVTLKTNMIALVEDEYARYPDDPELAQEFQSIQGELQRRTDELLARIDEPPQAVRIVAEFFEDKELVDELVENKRLTSDYIAENHGISYEALESYYKWSKFNYECGFYEVSWEMLRNYLRIHHVGLASQLGARWGLLASQLVLGRFNDASDSFDGVKEAIDSRSLSPADQLRQRGWLMHWAVFININLKDGPDKLVGLFSERYYTQTMENLCPWLLRYYAAAVVLLSSERRRVYLRDAIREISSLSYLYSDPITLFLESLFKDFDFDEAMVKLRECDQLLRQDFFLQVYTAQFNKDARRLICEMHCSINRRINLPLLAEKLEVPVEEAEQWMVDMIRGVSDNTVVDARIDSAAGQVIIAPPAQAGPQQVADKTRDLTSRAEILSANLQKVLPEQSSFIKHRNKSLAQ